MEMSIQLATQPDLSTHETVLHRNEGAWTLTETNLLRRLGVEVEKVPADPTRIIVRRQPRGASYAKAIGHNKFSIEQGPLIRQLVRLPPGPHIDVL